MEMVNSSASKLSTVIHTLPKTWLVGAAAAARQRCAQQEQCAVREQHEDRRPRDQRLAAPAPELEGGQPDVGRDDAGEISTRASSFSTSGRRHTSNQRTAPVTR